MLIGFILSASLILPGYWIIKLGKVKVNNDIERLSLSYIISLTLMFALLYLFGMLNAFNFASFIYLAVLIISFIHLFVLFLAKILRVPKSFKTSAFLHMLNEKLTIVIPTIGLLSIYVVFLSSRALLDSDVVYEYLPIAREIVRENGLTSNNGYDFNVLLKPIGVSVLYAWAYVLNGSIFSEAFRYMPLVPIFMLILLSYGIASSATNSKNIGIFTSLIFLLLPFHDRFLLYNAFYPDTFYYPLVFAATYFLLEYSKSKRNSLLFWSGVGLGVASLLKAQTIYVLIAFTLVLIVLEFGDYKKFLVMLCCFVPFYILIPNILANSIRRGEFNLLIPSLTGTQLMLFLFLSTMAGLCCYVAIYNNTLKTKTYLLGFIVKIIFKKMGLLLIPFAILSSLWYINNLFKFGTLIWTSSINLPNYDWALKVLQPLQSVSQTVDVWHYLAYFIFMFMDPAVMGYVMLVPFFIGLFFALRKRTEGFKVLFIFSIVLATVVLSYVTISINPTLISCYNPRDIFVLSPLLATTTAIGILFLTSAFSNSNEDLKNALPICTATYFGLLGYVHSVLIHFATTFHATIIGQFSASLARIVGLNLMQTSFQLSYADRPLFIGNNILQIILLSLIAGTPALILAVYRSCKTLREKTVMTVFHLTSPRSAFRKRILVALLILSVITVPRLEIMLTQGGIAGIKEFQLKNTYNNLYELLLDKGHEFEGGILTFNAPMGLPYYLQGIKVVDLAYPANLAFLKDCLLSDSLYDAVVKLKQQDIQYILVNPPITQKLDAYLNFTISKIIQNPEFAILSKSFGNWKLYRLGPFTVKKTFIPLSTWSVNLEYTNASYHFNSNESAIFIELKAIDINSRITIQNLNVPRLNLSDYDYIVVNAKGSSNARVLVRFFLDDGNSLDVSYWQDVYTLLVTPFDIHQYTERSLRGDMYISLKSSDGIPSSILIQQISFVKVED